MGVPAIDWALGAAWLVAALTALILAPRGGRFRGLRGWAASSAVLAGLLVCLSRGERWYSFPLLAASMFLGLRGYYSMAPVRSQDRYAILASYLAVPLALYPAYVGSTDTFFAAVPVSLFLFIPALVALGGPQPGLLDAMGRTLLGVVFYLFCAAHLGLLVHVPHAGVLELFGVLVLAADLPQRLAGRVRPDSGWALPFAGIFLGLLFAGALGYLLGPWCGIVDDDGARAGLLTAIAVALGGRVSDAVMRDLALTSSAAAVGRFSFLRRTVPAVYAAPVFFHYLNHFA
ncbi:MAG TPA: hypothetical protein VJS92_14565 [Candidatus Polarisedimenticolaceae bacterium]|nr:hypothetical protein [Candidatus Polarisedimenticolaceae bacterium]